ncbi:MAG TPA: DUF4126 family protein [Chthoniobacterales bacterium]
MNYILALAFGIGVVAGLRSLAAPAMVAWAARLAWLRLQDSSVAFMASTWSVIIFSALAIFELVADLLPKTPKRTAPGPLAARMITGGLCGACLCASANQSLPIGAVAGALGAVVGAFAGYEIRKRLVTGLNIKDLFIAIPEDLIAIGLALFFVTR